MNMRMVRSNRRCLLWLLPAACLLALDMHAQVAQVLGDLAPGQSVTITYEVTIDPDLLPGVTQIASQGIVVGGNFSSVLTDDPETPAPGDPTITDIANESPLAVNDLLERAAGEDAKIQVAVLLANDTDPDGHTLAVISVDSPTPGGAAVSIDGTWVYYDHNGTGPDTFTYWISDGFGGTAMGTVQVLIKGSDAQFSERLTITYDGAGAHIRFDGIPARSYLIQYQDALGGGPWLDLGEAIHTGPGRFTFDDPTGSSNRFYRSVFR